MSKQLNINPEMDKLARDNGLGHWGCVSPLNHAFWVRADGINCAVDVMMDNDFCIKSLQQCDKEYPIGTDWQQPGDSYQVGFDLGSGDNTGYCNLSELNKPTRTEDINGITLEYDLFGGVDIKIGDFVYVHINYDYRYTHNSARKKLAENIAGLISKKPKQPTLVQNPFQYPCDGALYFTKKERKQVSISGSITNDLPMIIVGKHRDMKAGVFGLWHTDGGKAMIHENNQYTCVGANQDDDLIMFVWA